MEPEVWGPPAWTFLHTITLTYPENPTIQDKENYGNFFNLLGEVLPCERCKRHYKKNIKELPINLNSQQELIEWLFNIHNKVNESNEKSLYKYDDFINKYSYMYDRQKKYLYLIIIVLIIFVFFLFKLFN